MSIRLIKEVYCENCPNFTPEINRNTYYDSYSGDEKTDTIICCSDADRCARIHDYIFTEMKKREAETWKM